MCNWFLCTFKRSSPKPDHEPDHPEEAASKAVGDAEVERDGGADAGAEDAEEQRRRISSGEAEQRAGEAPEDSYRAADGHGC